MKRALFIGARKGTSEHRHRAMQRLGYETRLIDPLDALPKWRLISQIGWHLAPELFGPIVAEYVIGIIGRETYDVVFVDGGSLVSPALVRQLKRVAGATINFNHDDPFGHRDRTRFRLYRAAVPEYDLVMVVRPPNVEEARQAGARRVLLTFMTSDPVEHAPRPLTPQIHARWDSDVSFVGTWMPERGPFMRDLVKLGVPLSLYGANWQKAPEWEELQHCWRGSQLAGNDYSYAIQCAKVSLGLLSIGNRDEHTTRSMEIPALGGLFCAMRTEEHLSLYRDREEAVFWDDAEECASICRKLLADEPLRARIAERGQARALANGNTNENLIRQALAYLQTSPGEARVLETESSSSGTD